LQSNKKQILLVNIRKHWTIYLLLLIPVVYIIIFAYVPMFGILIAFKEFSIKKGFLGGEWVGLKYFEQFVTTPMFPTLLKNTLIISLYSLIAGFPLPLILALALNEVKSKLFKKTVQMVTYAPHFISTVALVGIILQMLHPHVGMVNNVIELFGGERIDFMAYRNLFRHIYVWSGVWQEMGFSAIIYIAALAGVNSELVEAAIIEGCSRLQRVRYIDIPAIKPTIVVLVIMSIGGIMGVGFDKIFLMQNPINLSVSEVISTFVYKRGMQKMQYSYATAVGVFNSVVNFVLLALANTLAKKFGETSIW
jgi:putative aldouronate transport system permease protein